MKKQSFTGRFSLFAHLLLLFIFSGGCTTKNAPCLLLRAESTYPQQEIDISTYLHKSTAVTLSSDSISFSGAERIYPGRIFHLVAPVDKIMRFDTSGNFINTVANTGRGPGEVVYVKDLKTDASGKTLYCLENIANTIKVFDLVQMKHLHDIPLAKPGVSAFDFTDDSLLICFTVLNAYFKNHVLAYTQDLAGNVIKEIPFNTDRFEGPVYSGPPILHKTEKGYLYMQYPVDTVYLVGQNLSLQPLLAIEAEKKENEMISYKILFPSDRSFVLSITRHSLENQGDGNIIMFPKGKRYFGFDVEKQAIAQLTNTNLDHFSFPKTGYCVETPGEPDLHTCQLRISTLK